MNKDGLAKALAGLEGMRILRLEDAYLATIGDATEIYVEYLAEQDEVYLFCHVASIPEERFGRYAVALLEANLFGKDTGGSAVLAYDAEECRVVIWDKAVLANLSEEEFQERFTLLYLSKLHWANKMREDLLGGDGISAYLDGNKLSHSL